MKVLTLNIGAASVERAQRISDWLEGDDADVIVLTETSMGMGSHHLAARLLDAGYQVDVAWHAGDRGVLLAYTSPLRIFTGPVLPWRARGVVVAADDMTVIGFYGPSRSPKNRARKKVFFEAMIHWLRSLDRERLVLIGDYNAIRRDHEPKHSGFRDFEYAFHDRLAELGLRSVHGDPQPHSWVGRSGAGYLYDYVHIGPGLIATSCEYDDETCHQGLSDHAAVRATIAEQGEEG